MKKILNFACVAFIIAIVVMSIKDKAFSQGSPQTPIFDYNPNVYPHSTGLCYCGGGANCHPKTHRPGCRDGQTDTNGNGYICGCP